MKRARRRLSESNPPRRPHSRNGPRTALDEPNCRPPLQLHHNILTLPAIQIIKICEGAISRSQEALVFMFNVQFKNRAVCKTLQENNFCRVHKLQLLERRRQVTAPPVCHYRSGSCWSSSPLPSANHLSSVPSKCGEFSHWKV